jgi:hypothetical protein
MMTPPQPCVSRPETDLAIAYQSPAGLLGVLAAVLYVVSFFLPACEGMAGYQAFVISVVFLIGIPMWLANPGFWLGLLLLYQGKHAAAAKAGLLATALALSECWMFWPALRVGCFAWVGSMGLLAVAGWCGGEGKARRRARVTGWRRGKPHRGPVRVGGPHAPAPACRLQLLPGRVRWHALAGRVVKWPTTRLARWSS